MLLTEKILQARITCLDEAAEHLLLNWTDDEEEQRQAGFISDGLKRQINALVRQIEVVRAREQLKENIKNSKAVRSSPVF